MKVRKSSWYHWFYTFGFEQYERHPGKTNLCSYFWRTVWGVFKCLLIVAVVGTIVTVAGMCLYNALWLSIGCLAVVGAVIAFASNWTRIKFFLNPGRYENKEPEPGLLRSYIKAKKDKVCPLIEFVE